MDDPNEKQYGLRPATEWPAAFARRHRISLSVERGTTEGWIIQADFVRVVDAADGGGWQSIPLMRIKSLSRSQAWTVAAVVARLLDID
jgi:hypothetical protein